MGVRVGAVACRCGAHVSMRIAHASHVYKPACGTSCWVDVVQGAVLWRILCRAGAPHPGRPGCVCVSAAARCGPAGWPDVSAGCHGAAAAGLAAAAEAAAGRRTIQRHAGPGPWRRSRSGRGPARRPGRGLREGEGSGEVAEGVAYSAQSNVHNRPCVALSGALWHAWYMYIHALTPHPTPKPTPTPMPPLVVAGAACADAGDAAAGRCIGAAAAGRSRPRLGPAAGRGWIGDHSCDHGRKACTRITAGGDHGTADHNVVHGVKAVDLHWAFLHLGAHRGTT